LSNIFATHLLQNGFNYWRIAQLSHRSPSCLLSCPDPWERTLVAAWASQMSQVCRLLSAARGQMAAWAEWNSLVIYF